MLSATAGFGQKQSLQMDEIKNYAELFVGAARISGGA